MATEKIITENMPVRLRGFRVPDFVRLDTLASAESMLALDELPADVLDRLCRNFRDDVFERAGVREPPTAVHHCRGCNCDG